jgi:hypothetical protein
MNKTPETDEAQHEGLLRGNAMPTKVVTANFACKLEQQRNEAKEELRQWQTLCLWGGTPEHVHDFISIVHRQYSPYKDFAETTAFTIDKEDLLDILRPLAKLVKDERNEVFI